MIGIGMQGSGLLTGAITFQASSAWVLQTCMTGDIRWRGKSPAIQACPSRHYQELLDRKDIDCIVAAVPDHWHRRVVVDACNAGKDIYCEKPMSHNVADGLAMVEAAQKNNRIVQIGSQRVSSVLCANARDLYQKGAIGDMEMVELTLGRNDPTGAWEYPPPLDLSPENAGLGYLAQRCAENSIQQVHFARWRCWRAYGTGVAGDLMVHLISGMLVTLGWNEIPRSATAMGGIFRFKDGRDMPDFHTVLFDYHGIPVYVRLDLGPKRRNWRASWGRKDFWTPMRTSCTTLRRLASIWIRATTVPASRRRCARNT